MAATGVTATRAVVRTAKASMAATVAAATRVAAATVATATAAAAALRHGELPSELRPYLSRRVSIPATRRRGCARCVCGGFWRRPKRLVSEKKSISYSPRKHPLPRSFP